MSEPIRLQLSRRKGFDLQAASRAANGLEAVRVARPSVFGNPFTAANVAAVNLLIFRGFVYVRECQRTGKWCPEEATNFGRITLIYIYIFDVVFLKAPKKAPNFIFRLLPRPPMASHE